MRHRLRNGQGAAGADKIIGGFTELIETPDKEPLNLLMEPRFRAYPKVDICADWWYNGKSDKFTAINRNLLSEARNVSEQHLTITNYVLCSPPHPSQGEKADRGVGERGKGSSRGKPVGGGGMSAFFRIFVSPRPRRVVPSTPKSSVEARQRRKTGKLPILIYHP